jgi:hypothetical protein
VEFLPRKQLVSVELEQDAGEFQNCVATGVSPRVGNRENVRPFEMLRTSELPLPTTITCRGCAPLQADIGCPRGPSIWLRTLVGALPASKLPPLFDTGAARG